MVAKVTTVDDLLDGIEEWMGPDYVRSLESPNKMARELLALIDTHATPMKSIDVVQFQSPPREFTLFRDEPVVNHRAKKRKIGKDNV